MEATEATFSSLPVLDLSLADNTDTKPTLLKDLRHTLFNVGFLYIKNHGVPETIIRDLVDKLPRLFDLPPDKKAALSKLKSPHFLGYSGFAEETTLGNLDLREQFDFASELPVIWQATSKDAPTTDGDYTKLYWRLRGPNQWPEEHDLPGFRAAFTRYHDAVASLSYNFLHLVEEAFSIPVGTCDSFFRSHRDDQHEDLGPQHRIKLLKYPPSNVDGQGVGPHKDSSGWLTFLYQVGDGNALEVINGQDEWISAPPIPNTFVVNFGNAFEAATEGAVRATIHRVKTTNPSAPARYSIPFFQGLPLDLTVTQLRSRMPEHVRRMRKKLGEHETKPASNTVDPFLDPRWEILGESQLRKWLRSHEEVGHKWYGSEVMQYYLQ